MPKPLEQDLPFWPHTRLRLAALCGMVGPPLGLLLVAVAIHQTPWFSFTDNALSDMGSWDEPGAVWFNVGVMLAGVMSALFVVQALYPFSCQLVSQVFKLDGFHLGTFNLVAISTSLLGAGSLGLLCVGLFTIDDYNLHAFFATVFFLCTSLGIIVAGHLLRTNGLAILGTMTFGLGWLSLIFVSMVAGLEVSGDHGIAIPELLAVLCMGSWQIGMAHWLWRLVPGPISSPWQGLPGS